MEPTMKTYTRALDRARAAIARVKGCDRVI